MNEKPKHLLKISDLKTPENIQEILDLSVDMQNNQQKYSLHLQGKNILFSFEKPSLRTKVGTESAISHLNGNVIHIAPENFLNGAQAFAPKTPDGEKTEKAHIREPLKDTTECVNQWCDAVFARVFAHSTLVNLAKHSSIPVINALCDAHHPMQALADLLTVQECLDQQGQKGKKIKISFVGDANNVAFSLFEIFLMMGHECSFAGPQEYSFSREDENYLKKVAEKFSGASEKMSFFTNAKKAVENADFVYSDTFISMGEEHIYDEKIAAFHEFQVNTDLLGFAKEKVKFMHCLPAHRGEEVSAEVIDNTDISLVYQQAKNRMVVSKGVFGYFCRNNE